MVQELTIPILRFVNPMALVTFTDPEIAQIGLSEAARETFGDTITVNKWDIARVDRAKCDDDEEGFSKLISDRRGVLIGATVHTVAITPRNHVKTRAQPSV